MKKLEQLAKNFFVIAEGDTEEYTINHGFSMPESTPQQKCAFLLAVIEEWAPKTSVCCGNVKPNDPEQHFYYKTPSTCGSCVSAQKILDAIFGHRDVFNELPMVNYLGERQYSCKMKYLRAYAEKGAKATLQFMEEDKKNERELKIAKEKEKLAEIKAAAKTKLKTLLGDAEVSSKNEEALLERLMTNKSDVYGPVVIHKDLVVFWDERSDWSTGSGGIARYSQFHTLYHGQHKMQEWNYRDRYDSSNDRYDLYFDGIGQVKVEEGENTLTVKAELLNKMNYFNRWTSITFEKTIEEEERPVLTEEEQATFAQFFQEEKERLMRNLENKHEGMPQMFNKIVGKYTDYRKPSVKQEVLKAKQGIGVLVLEEQIDHRVADPQIRYNVYVTRVGAKTKRVFEDHSYEQGEGSALVTVMEVKTDELLLRTRNGHVTTSLN